MAFSNTTTMNKMDAHECTMNRHATTKQIRLCSSIHWEFVNDSFTFSNISLNTLLLHTLIHWVLFPADDAKIVKMIREFTLGQYYDSEIPLDLLLWHDTINFIFIKIPFRQGK